MHLNGLNLAAQVVVAVLLLGIALVTIVVLEDASSALEMVEEEPADLATVSAARKRVGGAVGLVAIVAGLGLLSFLSFGAWARRRVIAPLDRLEQAVRAIARGDRQRRADESAGLKELASLGADINVLVDRLRKLERPDDRDLLLARAALEQVLDGTGRGAAVLDAGGRLLASNGALRDRLDEGGLSGASLLEREGGTPKSVSRLDEVRASGTVCGYVAWL